MYVYWTTCIVSVGLPASILEKGWYISLQQYSCIEQFTYLGFSLLEAPREHVLHSPLLGMYWLQLCPQFGAPTLEAMLLWRRLFIVLMTADNISPTSFPSNCPLLPYWPSYFNKNNARIHIIHYTHIHTSHIMWHYITWRVHVYLASSFLPHYVAGWLLSIHCVWYK